MFRDTEASYGNWTLDVYQSKDGRWICDYWRRSDPSDKGTVSGARRKGVVTTAKLMIDSKTATKKDTQTYE